MITDVAKALKCAADLLSIEREFEIPTDAIVGSDLGEDGQFWIWKKQPVTSEFIQED